MKTKIDALHEIAEKIMDEHNDEVGLLLLTNDDRFRVSVFGNQKELALMLYTLSLEMEDMRDVIMEVAKKIEEDEE
jgi:Tfp pilus assembly pilus retraction ATPase PilT